VYEWKYYFSQRAFIIRDLIAGLVTNVLMKYNLQEILFLIYTKLSIYFCRFDSEFRFCHKPILRFKIFEKKELRNLWCWNPFNLLFHSSAIIPLGSPIFALLVLVVLVNMFWVVLRLSLRHTWNVMNTKSLSFIFIFCLLIVSLVFSDLHLCVYLTTRWCVL